jgi:hypothetical protein
MVTECHSSLIQSQSSFLFFRTMTLETVATKDGKNISREIGDGLVGGTKLEGAQSKQW